MTRLVVSPIAERDLENIWWKIAVENESAATKLLLRIEDKITRLRQFPRLGPRRSDIRASSRMLVEGFYLVLYETLPDTDDGPIDVVEIVRVVDGRRDLTRIFGDTSRRNRDVPGARARRPGRTPPLK